MAWFTGQLLLLLVVAFLLGLLLGYLVWIWGWRKRVERSVDVDVVTREVPGQDVGDPRAADPRVAELEERVERLRSQLRARDEAVADGDDEHDVAQPRRAAARPAVGAGAGTGAGAGSDDRFLPASDADAAGDGGFLPATDTDAGSDDRLPAVPDADAGSEDRVLTVPDLQPARRGPDRQDGDGGAAAQGGAASARSFASASPAPGRVEPAREPDDLTRVEGIGPKMDAALKAAGITSYRALARADRPTLVAAIEAAGMRFAPSISTWPRQAGLLAVGDEAALEELQRRLVAGRDEGPR